LCTTECIAQNLYSTEPTNEYSKHATQNFNFATNSCFCFSLLGIRFINAVKLWVGQEKIEEFYESFGMIPSFLESLIAIDAYGKTVKKENWLRP